MVDERKPTGARRTAPQGRVVAEVRALRRAVMARLDELAEKIEDLETTVQLIDCE